MASLPEIIAIQASDAPQHTAHLRKILQKLKTENRTSGFTALRPDDDLSSVSNTLKMEDMILILLTNELEGERKPIKNRVRALKSEQPGLRVAEILVDNLIYDNDFITFPTDLKPIRDRNDMDEAWSSIGKSLRDLFPVENRDESDSKQLDVTKHPDYPQLLKHNPGSGYLFRRFGILTLFGFLITFIFWVFHEEGIGGTIFHLFLMVSITIGIGITGYGIFMFIKLIFNNTSRLPGVIEDKRVEVYGVGKSFLAKTIYYITLKFSNNEKQEVKVSNNLYEEIKKGDVGVAFVRERYLLDFRKLTEKEPKHGDQSVKKRLDEIKMHPDYPEIFNLKPGSAYFYKRFMLFTISGIIIFFIGFLSAVGIDELTRSDSLPWFVFIPIAIIGLVIIINSIYRIVRLLIKSTNKLTSVIADKRVEARGVGQFLLARTIYSITLKFSDGEQQEVKANSNLYEEIKKDDVGVAFVRDRYLLDFRKLE